MTGGLTELPPHQELSAGRRWWRRLRFLPLLVLGVCSALALGVGVVTTRSEHAANNTPLRPEPVSESATADVCRPPVAPTDQQPWFDDPEGAELAWQQHAEEIAQPYLVGPNGWTFWSDNVDMYASQAVGRTNLSVAEAERWASYLSLVSEGFRNAGVEFYIIVTPSTSSVYPEELPVWMQELRGATVLDQILSVSGDLPIIDLRQRLVEAKSDAAAHLFSWSNSHWTGYGGARSWNQIATCVGALYPAAPVLQEPEITGVNITGDYNEWAPFGASSPGADWAEPVYADPFQEVTLTRDGVSELVPGTAATDSSILPVETEVPEPWTGQSALILRDSMGGALSPLWQQAYSPTWQISHRHAGGFSAEPTYTDLVAQYDPDVVVLQIAERHLVNTPPAGAGY